MVPVAVLQIAIINDHLRRRAGRFNCRRLGGSTRVAFAFLPFRGGIFFDVDCFN